MADNLDPELQRQLNEEFGKLKEVITGMVPAMVLVTAAMKEQIAASKGITGSQKDGKSIVDEWLKAQSNETQASKAAAEATKKYNDSMNSLNMALTLSVASLTSFGKSLLTVGGGMSKYSAGVDMAGDALGNLVKGALGPFGIVIAGVTKAFTMLVGAVLKQNDDMLKGTDALAQMGIIGDITTTKFREMGAQAGYSVQRLEELSGVYKTLGSDLLALGGTATEGAKGFNQLIEADEKVLQQYSRLGISQNQLNKNQAEYIKLQIASGQQITERSKQDGSLRKASLEYTNNLLELSALTGMDVEELKKKQVLAAADQAFATKMAMMQDEELELRARAKDTNDKELEAKADSIKTDREAKETMLKLGVAMGMTGDQLKGFTHVLASGSYNEVSASFLRMGVDITEFEKGLASGTKTQYDFVDAMAQGVKRNRSQIGTAITLDKELANMFGNTTEMMGLSTKLAGKSKEDQQKLIMEEIVARKKQMQGGVDAAKDGRAAQETTERRMQIAGDQLVSIMQGPITRAFEMFQKAMNVVAKYLAKFATWLGAPDFTDMFKTSDELKQDQKDNLDALKGTTTQIAKYKEALDNPEQFKKNLQEQNDTSRAAYIEQSKQTEKLKDQYKNAKTFDEKVQIDKELTESRKLEQEKRTAANTAFLELSNARQFQNKQMVEDKLLALTKKKLELEEKQKNSAARLATVTAGEPGHAAYGDIAKKLSAGGITDKKEQANILAQIKGESGGVSKAENLNYSGSKLFEMFGEGNKSGNKVRFKNQAEAEELAAKGPEAIGNVIYGGRMGNSADEGYKYRGRGYIQLTGKENYEKFGKLVGIDLVKDPDLANDPEIAQRIAVEFFKDKKKAGTDLADISQVGKAVGYAGGADETKKRSGYAQDFMQQGRDGGVFSGSTSGYPVMLHGKEMIIPMPDTKSLDVQKTELGEAGATSSSIQNVTENNSVNNMKVMYDMIEMLSIKLDSVVDHLATGNDYTDQLLKYSRV